VISGHRKKEGLGRRRTHWRRAIMSAVAPEPAVCKGEHQSVSTTHVRKWKFTISAVLKDGQRVPRHTKTPSRVAEKLDCPKRP
jgi:hypothetical protein